MALTWFKFEGFEDGNHGIIHPFGTTEISSTKPRTGNYSIRVKPETTSSFRNGWVLVWESDCSFFQYVMTADAVSDTSSWETFRLMDANYNKIIKFITPAYTYLYDIYVLENLIGRTTIPISKDTIVEGQIVIDDTNGILRLWINGILDFEFLGDTGTASVRSMMAGQWRGGTSSFTYYDDIAIGDDRLYGAGFHKIGTLTQGHYDQWTPQGEELDTALDCVTPVPPSMDKYIKTTTDGHKQSFGHTGYTPADGIGAVIARHYGQGGGQVTLGRRHNSTDYMEVAPVGLPGAFGVLDQIYFEKPGGGAWDKTTLDATEFIIEAEIPA
jgi:hypothetical protein